MIPPQFPNVTLGDSTVQWIVCDKMIDTFDMSGPDLSRLPFTLEQLAAFVAVVEKGNVTRAAESLHLSQSTVTHHLKSFQQVLGVRLLEQVGRSVRPTDAGREFGASARSAHRALLDLNDSARSLSNVETGLIRIAASQTTVSHYLPSVLAEFLQGRLGLIVQVVPGNTTQVCEMVATAELDLGLIEGPLTSSRLVEQLLVRDEVVMVVANEHPLARHQRFSRRDLLTARYLAREAGSGTELLAEAMLGKLYHMIPRIELGQMDAVRAAVYAGLGFAALPRLAVHREIEAGLLTVLPIRPHSRWIRAIRRPSRGGPATEALWELLRNRHWPPNSTRGSGPALRPLRRFGRAS